MSLPQTGTAIPVRHYRPETVDLFMFSAASWLLHRIHYDRPFTTDHDGHPELLLHGPLQGVYLVRTIEGWLDGAGRIESISYRHLAPAYLGDELECGGEVTSADHSSVELEVFARKQDGTVTTTGKARVRW
jgi:3-methylfumaryl-CoA hydratase